MSFNLFNWIREGVRQSVILGVSDAIDSIGAPMGSEDVTPKLKAMLAPRDIEALPHRTASEAPATRKRLGRSLKDLDMPARPAAE